MENLQIEASYVVKLLILCGSGVAYYLSLKNNFNIINERQKVAKTRIDFIDAEIKSIKDDDIKTIKKELTILQTKHDDKWCEKKEK